MFSLDDRIKRRQGIGASEAAAALGLSRYKTPFQLYLEKIGEIDEDTPETAGQSRGKRFEPLLRSMYEEETGRKVALSPAIQSDLHPFMFATPDGIVAPGDRGLEIKTARNKSEFGEPGSSDIPQEYLLQVQHQMICMKVATVDVYVAFSLDDVKLYEIPADKELQELIIEQEGEFWQRVTSKTPPELATYEDVRLRFKHSQEKAIVATSEIEGLVNGLRSVKAGIKEFEAKEEFIKLAVMKFMEDKDTLIDTSGGELITWKETKAGTVFDEGRFKAENAELFHKYLKAAKTQRRFLIKGGV